MTFKAYLSKYYTQLEKDFLHHHRAILNDSEVESVTQLRANINKQKAFYQLLLTLDSTFKIDKVLPVLNEFYYQTDSLRALQVEEEILLKEENKLHISHRFSNVIHKEEKAKLEDFKVFEENFPLRPILEGTFFVRNAISHLTNEKIGKGMTLYFKDLKKKIALLSGSAKFENELLENLKVLLNEFYYNWEMISQCSFYSSRKNVLYRLLPIIESIDTLQKYTLSLEKVENEKNYNGCLLFVLKKDRKKALKEALKSLDTIPYVFRSFDYRFNKMIKNLNSADPLPCHFSNTPKNLQEGML